MSLCINSHCLKPENLNNILFCQTCGSELILQGRYRVIRELGRGGFGITFEINEIRTNQDKVLKVLTNNQQKAIDLFKQEAHVLSQLHHHGIPKVEPDAYFEYYPHNIQKPIHCLVMEKIEGEDLQQYMQKRNFRPIDQTLAVAWLKDLVIILQQIHNKNFFHRDIKPSNIMLRANNGQLALIDFGTVRQITSTVVNQQGLVTQIISVGYTPSEQINNNAVPQSDFFALGRTFVYLLTGKEPLDTEIYNSYDDELKWRDHAPQISSTLADLIDEMMQRLCKDRLQKADAILQRLALIETNSQPSQPQKIKSSRRDFLQTSGLIIVGFSLALVRQNLFKNQNNQPTPKNTKPPSNLRSFNFEILTTDTQGNITNRRKNSAKYFTEDLGNGVFLEMVKIPEGKFLMGSPTNEKDRNSDESPQHQVIVPSFFMGKYELTQAQYQAIMGDNPSKFKGDNRPVEQVNWNNAIRFCQTLSQKTGRTYNLPTAAEWEYACRAGTTTPFYFGESITPDLVNYNGNYPYASAPKDQYRNQTTDVGNFPPNPFGLYDMHGNVWEWCQDDYQNDYTNAPGYIIPLADRSNYPIKVLRGGCWFSMGAECRSATRFRASRDGSGSRCGFRVVFSPTFL